jgi:iron(III) transport system substrate-binding protein
VPKILSAVVLLCAAMAMPGRAQEAPGQESPQAQMAAAAAREGALEVHGTTDRREVAELLAGFRALHPGLRVDYVELGSEELYDRIASGGATADLAWSAAMDLQIKLVNDGFAQAYASPEAARLPPWAVWRQQAYGTTVEPVVMVYNTRLLAPADVPRSHADLTRLLTERPEVYQGRLATYDPERSGVGFLLLTQDIGTARRNWDLVRAMGQVGAKLYSSSGTMLDRVAAGDQRLAYNILGSYALQRARQDPALGVVFPSDYTLVLSRIAFIPRTAPHPNAARLFLDYLLSREGQRDLAARSMAPVRDDMAEEDLVPASARAAMRPIRLGPDLLTYLDQAKRGLFLREWRRTLQGR